MQLPIGALVGSYAAMIRKAGFLAARTFLERDSSACDYVIALRVVQLAFFVGE